MNGKEKRLALGAWPEVRLADARQKRDDAHKAVQGGSDPLHNRKMEKIASKVSVGNSFASVAEEFIQVKFVNDEKAERTIRKARWFISLLAPAIGARTISEIEPAELLVALRKLEAKGHRVTARSARSLASRVFRDGVVTTRCKSDPAALFSDALSSPVVKHFAAITDLKLLGEFLRAVDAYTDGPLVKIAMQLTPHLFLRPSELRLGRWEEIDWEGAIWRIPAERTKLRQPHSAPLSRQALELLRELQPHSSGFDLMFPGQRSHLRPISENTLNATC